MNGLEVLLLFGPAVLALNGAIAAVWMYLQIDRATTPAGRVLLWVGIIACGLVAFGIGSCYAVVFSNLSGNHR